MHALDGVDRLAALRATGLLDSEPEAVFDDVTALAAHMLGVPVALISLVDDQRQFFKSHVGLGEPWASKRETPLTHSFCQYAVIRGGQLVVTDAREDELVKSNRAIGDLGVVAYAGVPIHARGEPIGVVCAIDHAPRGWSDAEMQLLARLAAITTRELERRDTQARLLAVSAELREQHELLRAVIDSMDEGVAVVDADGSVVMINHAAERAFGTDAVADATVQPPTEMSAVWGLVEADGVTPLALERVPVLRALRGEQVSQQEMAYRTRPTGELRWQSVNAGPIRSPDGAIRGAVAVGRDITELKRARDELERSATRDGLTGIYNRRGIIEHARLAMIRAERSGRPLALLFLDVDGLKPINDVHGHHSGDQALMKVAEVLCDNVRGADVVGRLGGDEFLVVACDYVDDPDGAILRQRIEGALVACDQASGLPFRIAASVGVEVYQPSAGRRPLEDLLTDADQRMYAAKRARRAAPPP